MSENILHEIRQIIYIFVLNKKKILKMSITIQRIK